MRLGVRPVFTEDAGRVQATATASGTEVCFGCGGRWPDVLRRGRFLDCRVSGFGVQ